LRCGGWRRNPVNVPVIDPSTLLSTLAQVSGTLAALIGFLGLWKLDGLEREDGRVEHELRQLMSRHRQVGDYGLWTLPRHRTYGREAAVAPNKLYLIAKKDILASASPAFISWRISPMRRNRHFCLVFERLQATYWVIFMANCQGQT
jgi:hypothetical protein